MSDVELAIEGMHCDGCVRRVTALLKRVDGVSDAKVEIGRVRFQAAGDGAVDVAVKALVDAGFGAKPHG